MGIDIDVMVNDRKYGYENSKGFYTLEAVIFLPLVLLALYCPGYFMKVEEGRTGKCFLWSDR